MSECYGLRTPENAQEEEDYAEARDRMDKAIETFSGDYQTFSLVHMGFRYKYRHLGTDNEPSVQTVIRAYCRAQPQRLHSQEVALTMAEWAELRSIVEFDCVEGDCSRGQDILEKLVAQLPSHMLGG
jgi:hypothetical protein